LQLARGIERLYPAAHIAVSNRLSFGDHGVFLPVSGVPCQFRPLLFA
jgi:hypothetical protein